jgi:outer membrane protein assembly factor BamB
MNQRQHLIEQIRQQSIHARAKALREAVGRQSNMVPIAGAASTAGGRRGVSLDYWIQTIYSPVEYLNGIYLQSLDMDSTGAVYSLSYPDVDSQVSLLTRKFSNDGSISWQSSREATSFVNDLNEEPNKIFVYAGHVYSLYTNALVKQTVGGELVWQYVWVPGESDPRFNFIGLVIDSQGSIFICSTYDGNTYVHKVSSETGEMIKTVQLSVDANPNTYFNASPVIDSEGNVIVACNWTSYYSTIIKIDPSLTTILGSFTMDEDAFGGDCDVTSVAIDQNDILYAVQYGESVYALDTRSGTVLWTKQNESNFGLNDFHLAASPSGNVYWVGIERWDDVGGGDARTLLKVIKLGEGGAVEWATGIRYLPTDDDFVVTGWYSAGTSAARIVGDALLITGGVRLDGDLGTETILKLPLTQVLGTYGEYEFIDITDSLLLSSPSPVEIPVTATLSNTASAQGVSFTTSSFSLDQTKIINKI